MRSVIDVLRPAVPAIIVAVALFAGLVLEPADAQPSPSPTASALVASPSGSPVLPAEGLNIAFDQIDRTISGAGTPPPFTTFAQDVAAIQAYQSASLMPSSEDWQKQIELSLAEQALSSIPFGSTAASIAAQAQQMAMQRKMEKNLKELEGPNPGILTRYFFYRGWTRVETRTLVLIVRPDRRQRIYINPVKKTYRIEDFAAGAALAAAQPDETIPPNPAKVDANVVTTDAEPATIPGEAAIGFRSEATTTLAEGIDPCLDGTYKATQLEYFVQGAEPLTGDIPDAQAFYALTLPRDCYIVLAPQHAGPTVPYQQMYVYRLVSIVRDAALAAQPTPKPGKQSEAANAMQSMFGGGGPGANYMRLSERGNIRQLTGADAPLFDVPEGYTQAP
jgi:hypothetical protein